METKAKAKTDDQNLDGAEQDLAQLMNLAGKMRMLSHRTVMFALLAQSEPRHRRMRDTAMREFSTLVSLLNTPNQANGVCPAAQDALAEVKAISPNQIATLESFLVQARHAINARDDNKAFETLGEFVGSTLLDVLNTIIAGIQKAIQHIGQLRENAKKPFMTSMETALHQIDRLANSLQIVATNASIEAQRAGTAGRAFRIISDEMRSLSQQSRKHADRIGTLLENVSLG